MSCQRQKLCNTECDYCHNRSFAASDKAEFWSLDNSKTPRDIFFSSGKKFWFDCEVCDHKFEITPNDIKRGRWCPFCSNKVLCEYQECETCFKKSCAVHPKAKCWSKDNKQSPRQVFLTSHKKYMFFCRTCNHDFEASPRSIKSQEHCPYCFGAALCGRKECTFCFENSFASHQKVIFWSEKNKKEPHNIRKGSKSKFLFLCPDCKHEFSSMINNVNKGAWCNYCNGSKLCSDEECDFCFEKSFASHSKVACWSNKNNKTPRECRKHTAVKYFFICDKCDNEFKTSLCKISNEKDPRWCPFCKKKSESKLKDYLDSKYKVLYQPKFEWCRNPETRALLPFDFLLEDLNVIIELDGPQHFKQISNWLSPEETQKRDKYKELCATKNGYSVIRLLQEEVLYDKIKWKRLLDRCVQNIDGSVIKILYGGNERF